MKDFKQSVIPAIILIILYLFLFCSCKNSTGIDKQSICFSVDRTYVTVKNFLSSGGSQTFNLEGGASWISSTIESDGETHTVNFTNITRSDIGYVQSFDATIDGKAYSYPANAC